MKKTALLASLLASVALLAPTAAHAQKAQGPKAKLMEKYDLNKNGAIDGDEIAAVRKDFAANPTGELARFDTDKDGKFSDAEIAAMKPPGGKGAGEAKKQAGTKAATPAPEAAAK